jgi:hypothetical protein
MGPLHFNWNVSVADLLVILGIVGAAARYIVISLRAVLHRMDLHEEALIRAGWLRRNMRGELEVRAEYYPVAGR